MEKSQGKVLDFFVEHHPQLADDVLAHVIHEILLAVHAHAAHDINHHHGQGEHHEHGRILVGKDIVHDRFDQIGRRHGGGRNQKHGGHGHDKATLAFFDQRQQAPVARLDFRKLQSFHLHNPSRAHP